MTPLSNCLGLSACLKLKILAIEYEFKARVEFLPCEYKLKFKVENWENTIYIFEDFGKFGYFLIHVFA